MTISNESMVENLTFNEINVGQQASISRIINMDDINAFALVSGDLNPAHIDFEYAQGTRFGGVIAHGMFSGALISSLLGTEFPGPGTIYLEQSLRFQRPVHLGDRLVVSLVVTEKDDKRGNLRLDCRVINQRDECVVSGQALVRAPTEKIQRPRANMPTLHLFNPEARLKSWMNSASIPRNIKCAVVHPCDENTFRGAIESMEHGFISPIIIGPSSKIYPLAKNLGLSMKDFEFIDTPHSHAAAEIATELAATGKVSMLMKGSLHTDELMHAVLSDKRLRTGRRMSHVFRFEVPAYSKPLLLTDAAINIEPSIEAKVDIIKNAISAAQALGIARPKVAILSAVETVSPSLKSTLDAACLCKMADREQIKGAILDGPLAFDNAISAQAAQVKGINSSVSGDADILVAPDLESANMLAKQLDYLAGAAGCGVVLGATIPIALTSRSDTAISRVASSAFACVISKSISESQKNEQNIAI